MPGWYVHLESAHDTAEHLRNGTVPPGFAITATQARAIGEHCHTWRNYLALGSLGPDVFYLLPDFKNTTGQVIRQVVKWALDVWEVVDGEFVSKWEKWIDPISTNNSQLASQLTGGLSTQLAQVLDELTSAIMSAFKGLLAEMGDWFGILTSGVPQGFGDDAFYWSDIFHYRRTYQFPFVLFQQAQDALAAATTDDQRKDAEARIAFAVGWMSHCATDVTGHPFTNAKSGGPYRDHWQRHHLVENHMDSENYGARHPGPLYGEYGASALHFRLAFRHRDDAPYNGRDDAPAYDYWTGLPAYDNGDGPTATSHRHTFFDLDTGPLPDHLVEGLLAAMTDVYGADGPHILLQDPPFSATDPNTGQPDGRPNDAAMAEMWEIVYRYLKMTSSDGISLRLPPPPSVFTDHSFPTPPGGGGSGIDDDPSRGADVDDDDSFTLLDLLLALFAWAVYLAQVVLWLATILPSLIIDITTFPAREVIYWAVIVPAWNLYLLARRALVMSGFAMPKPAEINPGLTTLGRQGTYDIASALDSPFGLPTAPPPITEPSGRLHAGDAQGLDHAYPRGIVRDLPSAIGRPDLVGALGLTSSLRYLADAAADEFKPSEWVAPWRYPLTNQNGDAVAQEGSGTHVGPYVVGSNSTILLSGVTGNKDARDDLERAATPAETEKVLDNRLPADQHLGGPVDYGLYLVGRMAAEVGQPEFGVPDFNLDSDRGYAWHTWDWDRSDVTAVPDINAVGAEDFSYPLPCTSPQFFHADHDFPAQPGRWYAEPLDLNVHYVPGAGPDTCIRTRPHHPNTDPKWRERLDHKEG
ncbi:MAG: zinc dependent phospholipase C family protein [Propionicimonas sp.]